MSGFEFGRGRGVGKSTLCWGAVSSQTRPPKNRKCGNSKPLKERKKGAEKRKIQKIRKRDPKTPNLLVFPMFVCWRGIAKGLGADEKVSRNNADTTQLKIGSRCAFSHEDSPRSQLSLLLRQFQRESRSRQGKHYLDGTARWIMLFGDVILKASAIFTCDCQCHRRHPLRTRQENTKDSHHVSRYPKLQIVNPVQKLCIRAALSVPKTAASTRVDQNLQVSLQFWGGSSGTLWQVQWWWHGYVLIELDSFCKFRLVQTLDSLGRRFGHFLEPIIPNMLKQD